MTECNRWYFENNFKVCSDEWCDRSLINYIILDITYRIESKEDSIKEDTEYIQKDIGRGFYPSPWSTQVEKSINEYKNDILILTIGLNLLKKTDLSDQKKLRLYWDLKI